MGRLGKTARKVRRSLGLSQAKMAEQLKISIVQLSKIENDHAMPSPSLIDKYREVANVDLYVMDWCGDPDMTALPVAVREAAPRVKERLFKGVRLIQL
ncbi:MAG: helix-turn-helix transcriptional regulator [Pirellulaceae bacterium]